MSDVISVLIVVAALAAIIAVPVGIFNVKLFQALNGTKCGGLNLVKAFVPFHNITFARKLAYGRATVYNIVLTVCLLLLLFRAVAIIVVATVPILIVYSSITTIACVLIFWLFYIINAVDFCRMLNCGITVTLCSVVIPPVGYYMLSTQVLSYFRSVEDDMSGTFGD